MRGAAASLLLSSISATLALASCTSRRTPIASCADNLHGVWVAPGAMRWMLLDNGATLEGYPLFDDAIPEAAPRVIDLRRDEQLAGTVMRRFIRRAAICEARAPIRVTACTDRELQVVLGEVTPPLQFAPCAWSQPAPSRVETWRRQ